MISNIRSLVKNHLKFVLLSLALIISMFFSGCDEVPVKNIYIEGMPERIVVGDSINLTAVIDPYDATDKTIDWFTPTKNLIKIDILDEEDKRNITITALSAGTAMIVVTARDGNIVETVAFQIYSKDINLTLGNIEKEYNSSPQPVEVINVPDGVDVEYTYTLRGTNQPTTEAPIEVGVYDVVAKIVSTQFNGECTGVLTIKKQKIIVQAMDKEKTYADRDPALAREIIKGKIYSGASISGSLKREVGEDVGEYKIIEDEPFTINGEKKDNYELIFNSGIFTIKQATLNMIVKNKSSQYGLDLVELEYTVTGFKNNEDESVLIGELSLPQNIKNVGEYNIINNITAKNYKINANIGKYTITKAPIIINAEGKTKIYGNQTPEFTYTITNSNNVVDPTKLFYDDELSGDLYVLDDITAGNKAIKSNLSSPNYQITYYGAFLVIEKRQIEITISNLEKIYGDADPEDFEIEVISDLKILDGDQIQGFYGREAGENIGEYNLQLGTLQIDDNYNLIVSAGKLTIIPKSLTIKILDVEEIYGDNWDYGYSLNDNIASWDNIDIQYPNKENYIQVGEYQDVGYASLNITDGSTDTTSNYNITQEKATIKIYPREITIACDDKNVVYGEDVVLTYTIAQGGLVYNDAFTGELQREQGASVGEYAITRGTLNLNGNYNLQVVNGVYTITPRDIEITIADKTQTYGEGDETLTYVITQGALVVGDEFSGSLSRERGVNVGTYTITQNTLTLGNNYNLSVVAGTYTIVQRDIEISLDNKNTTYGEDVELTYTITQGSLAYTDEFTGLLTRATGVNVGTYAITQGTLMLNSNYNLSVIDGTYTITPRAIEVVADNKAQVYGDNELSLTYTITQGSLVVGDVFFGALTRESGVNVGTYAITQGTLTLGSNYNLSVVAGQYEITKRPVTIVIENKEKVVSTQDPTFTWIYNSQSLQFVDNVVEINISRETGEEIGTYTISANASNDDNYDITFINGTLTIVAE